MKTRSPFFWSLRCPRAMKLRTPVQASPLAPFLTRSSQENSSGSGFINQYFIGSILRTERARQQAFDGVAHTHLTIENSRNRGGNRHLDALVARHLDQHRRGEGAFRQLGAGADLIRRLTFAKGAPERKVARLRARTRQNQIAEARE